MSQLQPIVCCLSSEGQGVMGANLGLEFHPHPSHTVREKAVILTKLVPPTSPPLAHFPEEYLAKAWQPAGRSSVH